MDNNYKALARKWRPKKFSAFVGQENVVKVLTNSLDHKRLHHAYLFSGTRGVGKTTLARLIAKCISCQEKISSEPCGKCSTCQSINQGAYLDLIEVDAASKTKVEDTRELLDNIQFSPAIGKFKIYIIDEVHMLSKHSFNALLKTLEEPPEHIKFIFATTEVDKLPITIISRCIHFKLKAIPEENIQNHLKMILDNESIKFENSAIAEIAKSANGSIRDSLSILEQCIAFCNAKITLDEIHDILGTIKHDHVYDLLSMILKQNATGALHKIAKFAELSVDLHKMLEELISILHIVALAQISSKLITNIQFEKTKILEFASQISKTDTQLLYQIALVGRKDMMMSSNLKSAFEMLIVRMIFFQPNYDKLKYGEQLKDINISKQIKPISEIVDKQQQEGSPNAATKNIDTVKEETNNIDWNILVKKLNLKGVSKIIAERCYLQSSKDNAVQLVLDIEQNNLLSENIKLQILKAMEDELNENIKLSIVIGKTNSDNTPYAIQQKSDGQNHQDMKKQILSDQNAKEIMTKLDAELTDVTSKK